MEDTDTKIMKAFKELHSMGKKEVPMDTIVFSTRLSPQRVHTRLNSLSKFGFVRKKRKKPVYYWEMV